MKRLARLSDKVMLFLIVAVLVFSAFLVSTTVDTPLWITGQKSSVMDRADAEFRRAFIALKEAEASGVEKDQLAKLVDQLNLVLWMIDRAGRLSTQGDLAGAAAQAERSIEVSRSIVLDAVKMRQDVPGRLDLEKIHGAIIGVSASLSMMTALYLTNRLLRGHKAANGKEVRQLITRD